MATETVETELPIVSEESQIYKYNDDMLIVNRIQIQCSCNDSDTIIYNENLQTFITNTDIASYIFSKAPSALA